MRNSHTFQTLIITLGKSSEKIILLLLSVILSRYLSVIDYGIYKQTLLVYSTLIVIFTIGIPSSISYFIPQFHKEEQKTLMIQTYVFLTILGILLSILIYLSADIIALIFHSKRLSQFLKWFALYPIFFLPTQSYTNFLISIERAKLTGILSLSFGLTKLIMVLCIILLGLSIQYIFISLVLFSTLQFIIILGLVLKIYRKVKLLWNMQLLKKQLYFALPIGLSAMVGILIKKMDQIMISTFFSPEQYAIYVNGAFEIPFLMVVPISAMAVLMPYLVKCYKNNNKDDFVKKWGNSVFKVSLIVFPVTMFFIFFAQESMVVLFSKKYFASSYVLRIYLLSQIVRITIFGNIFLILGKTKLVLKYSIIALLLNIVLNFMFINLLGFIGPAIATVISIIILAFMQLRRISSIIEIKLTELWPWKKLLLLLSFVLIMAIISSTIKILDLSDIITLILGSIIFILLYYCMINAFFSNVLPQKYRWRR